MHSIFSCSSSATGLRIVIALFGLLAAAGCDACQRLSPEDPVVDDVKTLPRSFDLPDRYYGQAGRLVDDAYECQTGQEGFQIEMSLTGLTYARDVAFDGRIYPAYSLSGRSLLVAFQHGMRHISVGATAQLRNGATVRNAGIALPSSSRIHVGVQVLYFFPGGAMESVPRTHLGTIEAWPESDPTQRTSYTFSIEINVPPTTCTLANASHTLDDVLANELATSGSNAKESSFDVAMNCPMDNIDVQLSLADANDPGSSNGQLAPAPGATAGGVQVQLLRGGQPVQFGQAWSHGWSSKGQQSIPFSARYLRTADPLVPGLVKGEAVLTADYR